MKKALIAVVLLGATVGIWRWRGAEHAAATDNGLAFDRLWIDHMPKNDRDMINIFVAITDEPVGVYQASSTWKGSYEFFRYEAHGDEIRMMFPQTNERNKVRINARTCSEKDMDFCLEIEGASRGVKRYYSRKGWEVSGHDPATVAQQIETLERSLTPIPLE